MKHTVVAQQDCACGNALLLRNLDHRLCSHERAARAAQRAVSHDVDAIVLAKVDNLLLGKAGVVLNLVDGGDHGGVGEELLEISLAVLFLVLHGYK